MMADMINTMPEFAGLGPLFTSSQPVSLTESEAEYVVTCVKHLFEKHMVFHFTIKNTMEEEQLEQVRRHPDGVRLDADRGHPVPGREAAAVGQLGIRHRGMEQRMVDHLRQVVAREVHGSGSVPEHRDRGKAHGR